MSVKLHVNVDHVATLRQARGTAYPDPVDAARVCERAGAHGITVHLREDRRHIQDQDVHALRATVRTLLNLEMAATDEMAAIAERVRPDVVTLVPERREERTTEGGLDVVGQAERIRSIQRRMDAIGVRTSLFVAPDEAQLRAAIALGVGSIELHTGDYCEARTDVSRAAQLERLVRAGELLRSEAPTMGIAAGHGLTHANLVPLVACVPALAELNIGHAIISDAVIRGLDATVRLYLASIGEASRLGAEGKSLS
jgi:pyridoxine 5-phosphate synthase